MNGKDYQNPAWIHNESIRLEMAKASVATRLLASVPNFEGAYLGDEVKTNKPYNVLCSFDTDSTTRKTVAQLLDALIDFTEPVPTGAVQWTSIDQLKQDVSQFGKISGCDTDNKTG
jgi:putative ATP-dependent endonuclease of OLD family